MGRTRFVTGAFKVGANRVGYQESGITMGLAGAFKRFPDFDFRAAVFCPFHSALNKRLRQL